MTTTPNPHRPEPKRPSKAAVMLEAMARRVHARERAEPPTGPDSLYPGSFHNDWEACAGAQHRLEGLLRARSTFHQRRATGRPGEGSYALLSAAVDLVAEEVAAMPPTAIPIIKLAEAERATAPLDASAGVTAVLDAHGSSSESIEAFVDKLVSAMKGDATVMPEDPAGTVASTGTYATSNEAQSET